MVFYVIGGVLFVFFYIVFIDNLFNKFKSVNENFRIYRIILLIFRFCRGYYLFILKFKFNLKYVWYSI